MVLPAGQVARLPPNCLHLLRHARAFCLRLRSRNSRSDRAMGGYNHERGGRSGCKADAQRLARTAGPRNIARSLAHNLPRWSQADAFRLDRGCSAFPLPVHPRKMTSRFVSCIVVLLLISGQAATARRLRQAAPGEARCPPRLWGREKSPEDRTLLRVRLGRTKFGVAAELLGMLKLLQHKRARRVWWTSSGPLCPRP